MSETIGQDTQSDHGDEQTQTDVEFSMLAPTDETIIYVPPTDISVEAGFNPRKTFDAAAMAENKTQLKEQGMRQPLLCRRIGGDLKLTNGERRWRNAVELFQEGCEKVKLVPVIVRQTDDTTALVDALVANEGERLVPLEEAEAYSRFVGWGWTQTKIAQTLGKSNAHVQQTLSLLEATPEVLKQFKKGELSKKDVKDIVREAKAAEKAAVKDAGDNPDPEAAKAAKAAASKAATAMKIAAAKTKKPPQKSKRQELTDEMVLMFKDEVGGEWFDYTKDIKKRESKSNKMFHAGMVLGMARCLNLSAEDVRALV